MVNSYQSEENGNEVLSGNESIHTAIVKGKKKVDLHLSHEEVGDEFYFGDESMHAIVIKGKDKVIEDESTDKAEEVILKGWKYVEVAGSFDVQDDEGGGGFVLKDWEGKTLLARAFPALGKSCLLVEAYAVYKAMVEIITLGEEGVVFCLDKKFYDIIQKKSFAPDSIVSMVKAWINWCEAKPFRVCLWERGQLQSALRLSEYGRCSRQHCQWSSAGPQPPGLDDRFSG